MAAERAKIRMTVEPEPRVRPIALIVGAETMTSYRAPHPEAVFGGVVNYRAGAQGLIQPVEIIREA